MKIMGTALRVGAGLALGYLFRDKISAVVDSVKGQPAGTTQSASLTVTAPASTILSGKAGV